MMRVCSDAVQRSAMGGSSGSDIGWLLDEKPVRRPYGFKDGWRTSDETNQRTRRHPDPRRNTLPGDVDTRVGGYVWVQPSSQQGGTVIGTRAGGGSVVNGLSIQRRSTSDAPVLVLGGQLDDTSLSTVDVVLTAEIDATDADVYLDVTELDFVGSGGIELFVALAHRMAARDRNLRIVGTDAVLDRALQIAGIVPTLRPGRGDRVVPPGRTSRVLGRCGRRTRDTTPIGVTRRGSS
jgi:anti-anti-sigma factor